MKTRKLLYFLGAFALLASSFHNAHAVSSIDVLGFKPATDHGFYLVTDGSRTLGQWNFHGGLTLHFSNDALVLVDAGGNKIRDIVQEEFDIYLGAALGLLDWLNLGFGIGFVPYQAFITPATGVEDNGARMGEIHLDLKARLVNNENHPIGIAVVPFITFPTGSGSHFTGNGNVTGGGKLVLETARIGDRFSAALNVGAQMRKETNLSVTTVIDDQFLYSAAANFAFSPTVELIGEVQGWTKFDDFFDEDYRPITGQGALRFFPNPDVSVTVGGGARIHNGISAPMYRVFTTVAYVPEYDHYEPKEKPKPEPAPCPDADNDGVCDMDDRCPTETGPGEAQGCPPAPKVEVDTDANKIAHQKIYFEFDSDEVKPVSKPILDETAAVLKVRPDITEVHLEGHTDSVGTDEYNQGLSERRAASVKKHILAQGVEPSRVRSSGKGEKEPIASNDTDSGRAQNRRVEFHITVKREIGGEETVQTDDFVLPAEEKSGEASEEQGE